MSARATVLGVVALVAAAIGLNVFKYRVQAIQEEIVHVSRDLEKERRGLHVLNAEWAYLNRPDRLQKLADKYLELSPQQGDQIADVATLPLPLEEQGQMVPASASASKPSAPGVIQVGGFTDEE